MTEPKSNARPNLNRPGPVVYSGYKDRPEPDFALGSLHKALLVGSCLLAVLVPVYFWWQTRDLGGTLPMHYNTAGEVTRAGSVSEAMITVVVVGIATIGLVVLSRYPRIMNFPTMLTPQNVQHHYKVTVQMLVWVAFGSGLIMVVMTGNWLGWLGIGWVWVPLGIMVGTVLFCIGRMLTHQ